MATTGFIGVVAFVALAIWSDNVGREFVVWLKSIPLYYVWWGLGIGVAIALIILLFRTGGAGYVGRTMRSGWLWPVAVVLFLVVFGGRIIDFLGSKFPSGETPATVTTTSVTAGRLSADVVLPIIAQCESGGRQFDDDGNLITNPESSAVGKYQILEKLHGEKAKALGYDIRTEEGNEAYARILYAESGTQHWEADPRSRACWEPKVLALGGLGSPPSISTTRLVAQMGKPAQISVPPGWRWDMIKPIPTGWTTDDGYRDARNNRIQVFEVVPPAKEVVLQIALTKCTTPQMCAW